MREAANKIHAEVGHLMDDMSGSHGRVMNLRSISARPTRTCSSAPFPPKKWRNARAASGKMEFEGRSLRTRCVDPCAGTARRRRLASRRPRIGDGWIPACPAALSCSAFRSSIGSPDDRTPRRSAPPPEALCRYARRLLNRGCHGPPFRLLRGCRWRSQDPLSWCGCEAGIDLGVIGLFVSGHALHLMDMDPCHGRARCTGARPELGAGAVAAVSQIC